MHTLITFVGLSALPKASRGIGSYTPSDVRKIAQGLQNMPAPEASAETSLWHAIGALSDPATTEISLIAPDTAATSLASEVLLSWCRHRGIQQCESELVAGLQYLEPSLHPAGMRRLGTRIAVLARAARARGSMPALVIGGGFRNEVAKLTLFGALLRLPVHSIHDNFDTFLDVPPLPLAMDTTWMQGPGEQLLEVLENGPVPLAQAQPMLQRDPRLHLLVEMTHRAGSTVVDQSDFGVYARCALAAPPVEWPAPSDRVPARKVRLDAAQADRLAPAQSSVLALCRSPYVSELRPEESVKGRPGLRPAKDAASDLIYVVGGTTPPISLRVSTTATTPAERTFVMGHLRALLAPLEK